MTNGELACYVAVGAIIFGIYAAISSVVLREARKLDSGGKIRPVALFCFWPIAFYLCGLAMLCVRRDKTGPTDQITMDDMIMWKWMRRFPQARVTKFLQDTRNWRRQLRDMRNYAASLEVGLEEEKRKRTAMARLKAAQIAVNTVERSVDTVLEGLSEELAKKLIDEVHRRFQHEMKDEIAPIDV